MSFERDDERISIARDELFTRHVDEVIAEERSRSGRTLPPPREISPLRRFLYSPMFYMPFAACVGAFLAWAIAEPYYEDYPHIGGEVVLVNADPFVHEGEGVLSLTVAGHEVFAYPDTVRLEEGADGQPPYGSLADIQVGDFIEVSALETLDVRRVDAIGIRPATQERALDIGEGTTGVSAVLDFVLFPLIAAMVALFLLLAEGMSTRNWLRMIERLLIGTSMGALFAFLAYIPASILFAAASVLAAPGFENIETIQQLGGGYFFIFAIGRSLAWACIGAGLGCGMNLIRATKAQLKSSVLGGTIGGALGGLLFDPINRFAQADSVFEGAETSRMIGFMAIGLLIGLFVALAERLAREAWLVVRSGPLTGKAFVLYKSPTTLGSAPRSDIYLFKDADIDGEHAVIHRVGSTFEIEDQGSRTGTWVGGRSERRTRLTSGDQIVLGATVLDFEERAKRSSTANT